MEDYGHKEEVEQEGLGGPAAVELEEDDGKDERNKLVAGIAEGGAQKLHPSNCHQQDIKAGARHRRLRYSDAEKRTPGSKSTQVTHVCEREREREKEKERKRELWLDRSRWKTPGSERQGPEPLSCVFHITSISRLWESVHSKGKFRSGEQSCTSIKHVQYNRTLQLIDTMYFSLPSDVSLHERYTICT